MIGIVDVRCLKGKRYIEGDRVNFLRLIIFDDWEFWFNFILKGFINNGVNFFIDS